MRRFCSFCLKPIGVNEPTLKLMIGTVHEKCKLRRDREFFRERLEEVSHFPRNLAYFQRMGTQLTTMLENIIARGINSTEHKEFCNEWGMINKSILDFEVIWFRARHFIAQKNVIDRILSNLKGYPFVAPRTPNEIETINRLMGEILHKVTNYSIASTPVSLRLGKDDKKRQSKEEHIKALKELSAKFDSEIKKTSIHAKKDFKIYGDVLQKEHALWLQHNLLKLNEYGLHS